MALGKLIGQAHFKANDFVQHVSNPFTKAVGAIIDPLDAQRKAGTMTYEQALEANKGLEELIQGYTDDSTYFSALGNDHKTVVDNGWKTVNPYIADWRKTLAEDIARLKPPDAEEPATPGEDPPDEGTILTGQKKAKAAAVQQRKRTMGQQGRQSTILTGPGGLKTGSGSQQKTILGY